MFKKQAAVNAPAFGSSRSAPAVGVTFWFMPSAWLSIFLATAAVVLGRSRGGSSSEAEGPPLPAPAMLALLLLRPVLPVLPVLLPVLPVPPPLAVLRLLPLLAVVPSVLPLPALPLLPVLTTLRLPPPLMALQPLLALQPRRPSALRPSVSRAQHWDQHWV
ncbi:hypothetical protein TSOC_002177 [Tetrabaena socialis]|uniref:Uncharacterized protein n=1 Tax=Tetrabaena socialis TaxID=47790 RepID=A0A2J8AEU2_9CHLO|nr:hypothetical protein TSOC_002177 [Tetrabaena socialis]|eukprot:PNH11041.1 hypothetical protein TSOC_002177 [Tetrabaena socialis]